MPSPHRLSSDLDPDLFAESPLARREEERESDAPLVWALAGCAIVLVYAAVLFMLKFSA